ncbi:MAG: pyruvoyl-dependent arginine decarboxylase [Halobacteriota archaeon]|nr:pyruvoyl-dependent arginine decarboxylase [Halobacteriota archaeon]
MFTPKSFFVVSGIGIGCSELNAFDKALVNAGISECNLVGVSSILPEDCKEVDPVNITPGTITFCVIARMDGKVGETIGAGLGYGWLEREDQRFGVVCEHHGHCSELHIKEMLERKLNQMAKMRNMRLLESKFHIESTVVEGEDFGSVAVVLVYLP